MDSVKNFVRGILLFFTFFVFDEMTLCSYDLFHVIQVTSFFIRKYLSFKCIRMTRWITVVVLVNLLFNYKKKKNVHIIHIINNVSYSLFICILWNLLLVMKQLYVYVVVMLYWNYSLNFLNVFYNNVYL